MLLLTDCLIWLAGLIAIVDLSRMITFLFFIVEKSSGEEEQEDRVFVLELPRLTDLEFYSRKFVFRMLLNAGSLFVDSLFDYLELSTES